MLTAIFQSRAGQADVRPLLPSGPICLPPENSEWPGAYLAFGTIIFFEHLNVRVVRKAFFADFELLEKAIMEGQLGIHTTRHIRRLPS